MTQSFHKLTRFRAAALVVTTAAMLFAGFYGGIAAAEDSTSVRRQFASPGREYSSGPLWTWNDLLTERQIRSTLQDLAGQHVRQVWVHPRPGLMTPYLGEDWFRMWSVALDEAERLDMNVWIYDENSYPSGFAGGLVPEAMPDSRNLSLTAAEHPVPPDECRRMGDDLVGVFRLDDRRAQEVTDKARAGDPLESARYLVITKRHADVGPWFGGRYYVDLLKPGVTEKFLEVTVEPYRKRFGEHFGKRIPGVFTDEPNLFVPRGLPWTDTMPLRFERRWGYPLRENLPGLFRPVGNWKKVRHDYFQLVLEQFIQHWAKPFYEYCDRHGLEFTGHYWEHGWPHATHGPDNMAMYAWMHRPGIDILFNRYEEHTAAQFGNVRSVRELASVANQLGRRRTLCEAYGAGGWDLRLEDMKRIGDWMYALGVNTLNEHLSYVTIRGVRKTDHPQSFSYHAPWFESYHCLADHFTRLSLALSSGQQVHNILVLEPTTTAWMYQSQFDPSQRERLDKLGSSFFDLLMKLEAAPVEYDLGCEQIIQAHGAVKADRFVIGQRRYDTLVIPPGTESLNEATVDLLESYVRGGGVVVCVGPPPTLCGGEPSDRIAALSHNDTWRSESTDDLPGLLAGQQQSPIRVVRDADRPGKLFHHRRVLDDGQLLLLVNSDDEQTAAGTLKAAGFRGVECWDTQSGTISEHPQMRVGDDLRCDFHLPPCGSLLLFFSKREMVVDRSGIQPLDRGANNNALTTVPPLGETVVRRLDPNVLTIDHCDLQLGGQRLENVYCQEAARRVFQHHGLDDNPWWRAVQFRDELLRKTFPDESGFTATYRFKMVGDVPRELRIAIERADLYQVTCNGQPVSPVAEQWWLDRSFSVLEIGQHVRAGDNEVVIQATPLTVWHEVQPAYVLGDFSLTSAASGFELVSADAVAGTAVVGKQSAENPDVESSATLELAPWNELGMPHYGHRVGYSRDYRIDQPAGRYVVELGRWHGSAAKVIINGKSAGYIGWRPWQVDVSRWIRPGKNTIQVVVFGTLKNTLGPHHAGEVRGFGRPHDYLRHPESGPPPGSDYDTIPYGLFEGFTVYRAE